MIFITIICYAIIAGIAGYILYAFWNIWKYMFAFAKHQVPLVPSPKILRQAVIAEIHTHYPDMQTACDIGGGYGAMSRQIARECGMRTTSIENMRIVAFFSHVIDRITKSNSATVCADAFEYLNSCDGVDIAIAYLGPGINDRLAQYSNKFRVLITFDVPVGGLNPTRVIDLHRGCTRYGRKKFPHKLFVYEF